MKKFELVYNNDLLTLNHFLFSSTFLLYFLFLIFFLQFFWEPSIALCFREVMKLNF